MCLSLLFQAEPRRGGDSWASRWTSSRSPQRWAGPRGEPTEQLGCWWRCCCCSFWLRYPKASWAWCPVSSVSASFGPATTTSGRSWTSWRSSTGRSTLFSTAPCHANSGWPSAGCSSRMCLLGSFSRRPLPAPTRRTSYRAPTSDPYVGLTSTLFFITWSRKLVPGEKCGNFTA